METIICQKGSRPSDIVTKCLGKKVKPLFFRNAKKRTDPANHAASPKLPSPCLVARAGRKHLPVVTLKSQARRNVTKVPTSGPRKSLRSTSPVGGMMGALVVNLTCDVRRVAKLPSEPRGRPIKSDGLNMWTVSHSNTRTSHSNTRTQDTLGQGVSALKDSCEKAL